MLTLQTGHSASSSASDDSPSQSAQPDMTDTITTVELPTSPLTENDTPVYKLLIADDHPLFREAIADVIRNRYPNSDILEAENLESAAAMAGTQDDLDLILLDLNMPGMNGLNGLIQLRNESPTIPVVIISAEEEKSVVLQAMTYGAVGFIIKSLPREKMTQALEQVLAGQVYLPSDVIRATDDGRSRQRRIQDENLIPPEMLNSLTRRQLLVLERMASGESNKQIAYNLSIAETTVKAHVSAILRKLSVHNRIQAVLAASNVDFNQYLRR
ncbi:response regulator transcription factor [Oceanobacter sp. 5_MG-2023]|uniref:response regulator n=1 Tax=Oceanobacter sp. 5_MG-2023 TaxID=3062645 RepID=UPI0026E22BA9|nr:response regulator transcription factor [Oceanobacter sp. 5_MG-2023]MDO6682765.1 response regulator transcription factor [Oceanobacter sp. 5_MG-2023]